MATRTRNKTTPVTADVDGQKPLHAAAAAQATYPSRIETSLTVSDERSLTRLRRAAGRRFPQRKQRRMDALLSKASAFITRIPTL